MSQTKPTEIRAYLLHSRSDDGGEHIVPSEAASVDSDDRGRVLFKESIDPGIFAVGLSSCIEVAQRAMEIAEDSLSAYRVDRIILHLAVDAKLGCCFVGDSGVMASLKVELKRIGD
jgi:hypothetical protein